MSGILYRHPSSQVMISCIRRYGDCLGGLFFISKRPISFLIKNFDKNEKIYSFSNFFQYLDHSCRQVRARRPQQTERENSDVDDQGGYLMFRRSDSSLRHCTSSFLQNAQICRARSDGRTTVVEQNLHSTNG